MTDAAAAPEPSAQQVTEMMRSKRYAILLVIAAVVGVIVSVASWGFLELVYQIQRELYTHLPSAVGYHHGPPLWWSLPVLGLGAAITALAIARLPGQGGHLPANGLAIDGGPPSAVNLPGIFLAGVATIGSGLILGPEAPLIALGSGLAVLTLRLARREMPSQVLLVIGSAGSFAAISFLFGSPVIAAVLMIEVAGIGGQRLTLILLPGLLAAGIGTLVSIGMGSFTGLSSSAFALVPLQLPHFGHPDIAQFGWVIALAIAVAILTRVVMLGGLATHRLIGRRHLHLAAADRPRHRWAGHRFPRRDG